MNPLFIGTAARRVFAIHEPPAAVDGRARAAVLCYPWDLEYVYAHRSMRHLAARLTLAGFHTLRFDYFGSGDSGGEESEADLSGWRSDVELAIETLKDISDAQRVVLIGLRVGANVAAEAAAALPGDVETLVLWDPIVSGAEYVRELRASLPVTCGNPGAARMLAEFASIDLCARVSVLPARTLVLTTQPLASHAQLAAAVGARSVSLEHVTASCPWIEAATTSGALPTPAIQRIEAWLR